MVIRSNQDIVRLDISMDDARAMGIVQCIPNLADYGNDFFEANLTAHSPQILEVFL